MKHSVANKSVSNTDENAGLTKRFGQFHQRRDCLIRGSGRANILH